MFFLSHLSVEGLPVFFDGVFGVLVNWDLDDSLVLDFLLRNMEIFEVGMSEGFLNWNATFRVEDQHFSDQIQRVFVHLREERRKRSLLDVSNLVDALLGHDRLHRLNLVTIRLSQQLENPLYLVQSWVSWKDCLSEVHLSQNAANRPHVDCFGVLGRPQKNFRGSVPTGSHILGHDRFLNWLVDSGNRPGQPKISKFSQAIWIQQNIGRFEVPVYKFPWMHVLDSLKNSSIKRKVLIKHIFFMNIFHNVSSDDGVKIRFHKIKNEINIFVILCFKDVLQRNDIGMPV